jgi:phage shock protein C
MVSMSDNVYSGSSSHPLQRSDSDRLIAGVCGGLGMHTNVDPVVYRLTFAALTLLGGFGLLLYLVAWLLIPAAGSGRATLDIAGLRRQSPMRKILVVALLGVGLLALAAGGWGLAKLAALVLVCCAGYVAVRGGRSRGPVG